MSDLTLRQVAELTKQYLIKHGWTNDYDNDKVSGKVCVMVAAERALAEEGYDHLHATSIDFHRAVFDKLGVKGSFEVFNWNDSRTSVQPIFDLLDSIG